MKFIGQLAKKLNKKEAEVVRFLVSAPLMYKVYTIPKRSSGHRVIAQPSKELKEYQRAFLEMQNLPVHSAAMAYQKKLSIKDNANQHKNNKYLLKLDLENFFNSITNKRFWYVWQQFAELPDNDDKVLLERLLFWAPAKRLNGKLILSIGAPSSPLLSNFFMYQFDEVISKLCQTKGVVYTRYADDLTFSTNIKDILFDLPLVVSEKLRVLYDGALIVNRQKTVFASKAHNRHVTGITINNEGKLSIGRERKRYIKHLVHQYRLSKLAVEDVYHLKGLLAYAQHVEPHFLDSLRKKYSSSLISQIVKEHHD